MPEKQFITGLPGVQISDVLDGKYCIEMSGVAKAEEGLSCPKCEGQSLRVKATKERVFKHALWGQRLVLLKLRIPKMLCKGCSHYFVLKVSGILPRKRATEQFRQDVFHRHQARASQSNLSQSHSISHSTVERWYQDYVAKRVKELVGRVCPIVLGIDEHFFTRKDGYATTFVDLRNHKAFDVVLGKYEKDANLKAFLENLPGRDKVKVVVIDLCPQYRRLVKKYFPNAMIVADPI